ncbi:hypothetical protein KK083_14200 [Fulvivirgaceae bacterium PWU4]|uniref:N,N-dimethylformamidase beta subunit-like C-terminal domain-containing protein n=1 Tax=Chryseosolibacter histidini TaxID=2782349 RepID=A0AAP2DKK7_9BACT|nr:N,N-dimethylformamidase beta subunit family domain-containing protein [Chryseosolibacter histidini]MBT1698040.1 hypothetical protein [Chryseosolibacter histidini]
MLLLTLLLSIFSFQPFQTEIIDGYTNKMSAFPGDSIELYLNANLSGKHDVQLYDLSERIVFSRTARVFPQSVTHQKTYETGFGYKRTCKIAVPDVPSGVYLWENKIPFIVKTRNPKITIVYASNTVNAYCSSGGKSLYAFNSTENTAAQKVSFLRPLSLPKHSEAFLRWVVKENIKDVGYVVDLDMEDYNNIRKSRLIIITGHSEYWTLQARLNFDRFVNEGKNALILSGNTMWWQVRYNKSKDQLICYRDQKADPVKSEKLKTINWCEPSLGYPIQASTGTDFRNAGYGLKQDNGWDGYKIIADSPLLEGTKLKRNDVLSCRSDELDGAPLTSFTDGIPVVDYQALSFYKVEIVGYDLVQRAGKEGVATWIVFKPGRSSGIVINTASTDWCSSRGIGSNSDIQKITLNMITKLMNNERVFSTDDEPGRIVN